MFARPISARERRTVALGLLVSLVALLVAYVVVPYARRWQEREAQIAAEGDRLARLRGLAAHEQQLSLAVTARAVHDAGPAPRLLAGRTAALAASALQSVLQDYADRSLLTVSHLDVAGAPDSTAASLPTIPATISAVGDIYGITDFLYLIQHGSLLLETVELSLRPNPALRGELLQLTLTVRAAYTGT